MTSGDFGSMLKQCLMALPLSLLAGCALAPGGDLEVPSGAHVQSQADYDASIRNVNFIRINPALIDHLARPVRVTQRNPRLERQLRSYQYRIGVGDVLNVTVWEQPELTIPAGGQRSATEAGSRVNSNGTIYYPFAGTIYVAGKTVQSIRRILANRLKGSIVQPKIDVNVAAFRSKRVYVTGELNKPGAVPITDVPLTLLDALNAAGGVLADADLQDVSVSRGKERRHIDVEALLHHGDMRQNLLLLNGDVINVARNDKRRVFVMGEVIKPGVVPMKRNGLTLADALGAAKGINEKLANASGIFVIRRSADPAKTADVYQLDAKNMTAMVLAAQFPLKQADVIYVTAAPVARWNRLVMQILPTITSVSSSASTAFIASTIIK